MQAAALQQAQVVAQQPTVPPSQAGITRCNLWHLLLTRSQLEQLAPLLHALAG